MANKVLRCNDVMPGCKFEARGANETEVLQKAAEHARKDHNIPEITPDIQAKVQRAIQDEP